MWLALEMRGDTEVGGPAEAPNPSIWPLSWLQLSQPRQMASLLCSKIHRDFSSSPTASPHLLPKPNAQRLRIRSSAHSPEFLLLPFAPSPLGCLLAGWVWPRAWSSAARGWDWGRGASMCSPWLWRCCWVCHLWDKEEACVRVCRVGGSG